MDFTPREGYVNELGELAKLYSDVKDRLHTAYERSARQYNLRRRPLEFSVNDRVWKRNFTLSNAANYYSAKLAPKFIPAIVVRKISALTYELKDDSGKNLGVWHVKDLKANPD